MTGGKTNRAGASKPQQQSSGSTKSTGQAVEPALFLSPQYAEFKISARKLSLRLEPLGLSISMLERAVASYLSRKYTFKVDHDLLRALHEYQEAKVGWETFRDVFRASKDATTIPSGGLAKLLASSDDDDEKDGTD